MHVAWPQCWCLQPLLVSSYMMLLLPVIALWWCCWVTLPQPFVFQWWLWWSISSDPYTDCFKLSVRVLLPSMTDCVLSLQFMDQFSLGLLSSGQGSWELFWLVPSHLAPFLSSIYCPGVSFPLWGQIIQDNQLLGEKVLGISIHGPWPHCFWHVVARTLCWEYVVACSLTAMGRWREKSRPQSFYPCQVYSLPVTFH